MIRRSLRRGGRRCHERNLRSGWIEVIIMGIYKLKNEANKYVADCGYPNQFFATTTNAGNNGYRLNNFVAENNKGLVTVVRFLNIILTLDQPSRVRIEVVTTVIRSYLGLRLVNWAKILKDLITRLIGGICNLRGCLMPLLPYTSTIILAFS